MYIIYGSGLYGKVDHAPGLFYVATQFFHIWWIPIFPTGSYLMIDDNTGESGVPIRLSFKSWLMGWFRAGCFLAGTGLFLAGTFINSRHPAEERFWQLGSGLGLLALAVLSYFVVSIGRRRAVYLAECANIDPSFVHDHFDRLEGKPPPSDHGERAARPADGRLMDEALQRWNPNSET